ncbi:MAG: hypothetical protein FWF76_01965 [Oscillospiraceae bacterium]|nr:hypothetical protein [Oscillospiraceae bacterium]
MAKTKKKLLAALIAATMVFSGLALTGCGDNDEPNTNNNEGTDSGNNDEGTDSNNNEGTDSGNNNLSNEMPDYATFDFGAISFNARSFTVPADLTSINIGGNLGPSEGGEGRGASDAIWQVGFRGFDRPNCGEDDCEGDECENDGCGYDCEFDPDGEWATLVSQNGPFWANISRIVADFYIAGGENSHANDVGNIEPYFQSGHRPSMRWRNLGSEYNLLNQIVDEDTEFYFGAIMTAEWDINWFKNYIFPEGNIEDFALPAIDVNADDPELDANYRGGGINKFGLMVNASCDDNDECAGGPGCFDCDFEGEIRWTNVAIYVYDIDLFMQHVAEVYETTGGLFGTISENAAGNIRQAQA